MSFLLQFFKNVQQRFSNIATSRIFNISRRLLHLCLLKDFQGLPKNFWEQSKKTLHQSFNFFFFKCYLAVPWPTLGHSQGDSLTNPMLITAFVHIQPTGQREPRNEVGSLSPAKCLAGFELGTFRFLLQCLNPLGHSPRTIDKPRKWRDYTRWWRLNKCKTRNI